MAKLVFILVILVLPSRAKTQTISEQDSKHRYEQLDTLFVSPGSTTYLAFPEPITLVDIGNKDYVFKVEKNILLLKSGVAQGKGTNMLVRFSDNLFTGWLVHTTARHRSLYDYRNGVKQAQHIMLRSLDSTEHTAPPQPVLSLTHPGTLLPTVGMAPQFLIDKHIKEIAGYDDKFRTLGVVKHSLAFLLVNLMNDSSYLYLRFRIINKSNIDYNLDYVSFEVKRKGRFQGAGNLKVLQPVFTPGLAKITAHANKALIYVVPLYAPGEGGSLEVTFREANGNRRALLSIPGRALSLGGVFTNSLQQANGYR